MNHYVYIIYSSSFDVYYKGYSLNAYSRLEAHRKGESRYTRRASDWDLVYLEMFADKRSALIRERSLKKYSHHQISELLLSEKNIL